MSKLIDDPKLTAYALGELPSEQMKEFEMELNQDPQAQEEVKKIKEQAGFLNEELSKEETTRLDTQRIEAIHKKVTKKSYFPILGLAFGSVAVVAIAGVIVSNSIFERLVEPPRSSLSGKIGKFDQTVEESFMDMEKPAEVKRQIVAKKKIASPRVSMAKNMRSKGMALDRESLMVPSRPVPGAVLPPQGERGNREGYDRIEISQYTSVASQPLSTFSIDVDTAAYSNARRFINNGSLPPVDAVRVEEFINYFDYGYEAPSIKSKTPFAVHLEQSTSPWNKKHQLVRIGIKGKEVTKDQKPNSNLVFLLDVSGSMSNANKLPLLKDAIKMMVRKLGEKDRVAIVVYAGASGLVLPSTKATEKVEIFEALNKLNAGGSTNGGAGIELAYKTAQEHFIKGGINRVILATDGDFNVGTTSRGSMTRLIEEKAKSNIFLTVLGLGMGNYKDGMLEKLADKGNGNYAYLDTLNEAKKVLINDMNATLMTIAKDVKIQVEFNPTLVQAYRLVGYENRKLAAQDFNDDKKDAGEIGAGHTVTALYEVVPHGVSLQTPGVDKLKYQKPKKVAKVAHSGELLNVKLRYKTPEGSKSTKVEFPLKKQDRKFESASADFKFATAVASFAMVLRKDEHVGDMSIQKIIDIAKETKGQDPFGYREEFIENVEMARSIYKKQNR